MLCQDQRERQLLLQELYVSLIQSLGFYSKLIIEAPSSFDGELQRVIDPR